jgi:hypothetical protein
MDPEILVALQHGAVDLENRIKEKIESNIQPPNAPATLRRKEGYSDQTLIHTTAMLNAVTHQLNESGDGYDVGIFDEEIAAYAAINEWGQGNTPERSFLRSAYDENIDRISRDVADEITDIIIRRFELK